MGRGEYVGRMGFRNKKRIYRENPSKLLDKRVNLYFLDCAVFHIDLILPCQQPCKQTGSLSFIKVLSKH